MQRHEALRDLSRDHFVALNHVVKARRILEQDRFAQPLPDVWHGFLKLWQTLELHFDEEEEILLPLLDEHALEAHAVRLRDEHARLREAFGRMAAAVPDAQLLWNVAEALRIHVRWEEEHMFAALQSLPADALEKLAAANGAWRRERGLPLGPG